MSNVGMKIAGAGTQKMGGLIAKVRYMYSLERKIQKDTRILNPPFIVLSGITPFYP